MDCIRQGSPEKGNQYSIYTQRQTEFNELIHEVKVTHISYQQVGQWAGDLRGTSFSWMPCVHQVLLLEM